MDWRSGSRQNGTGSAFRGISTRSRGRGRGRGISSSGRGGGNISITTPAPTPAASAPPAASSAQTNPAPSINAPPTPKQSSRRGSQQPPRRAPSLSHIEIPKAAATPPAESTTPGGRPQVTRRASHNPIPPIPSVKLDPSTPIIPSSPRPKPSRKRSHNRTRSSSKASTTQSQLSAAQSVASFKEKNKETPPHMTLTPAPDVQSADLRTNIDSLVERVRAMAMAGSAADKDKAKEGRYTPSDGHIDWAGDEDDTLPDLDDWVRPKSAEPTEIDKYQSTKPSEDLDAQPHVEQLGLTNNDGEENTTKNNDQVPSTFTDRAIVESTEELKPVNEARKEKEVSPGKSKSRGRQGGRKGPADASVPTPESTKPTTDIPEISKSRSHMVHPLPPKPQVSTPPARQSRPRATVQSVADLAVEVPSAIPPRGDTLQSPIHLIESHEEKETVTTDVPEPQVKKRAFDPTVDWANAPRPSEASRIDLVREASEARPSIGAHPETPSRNRAFDPSVDWANAPSIQATSLTGGRSIPSPTRSNYHSSPHSRTHPHTAPPHGRSRGPFASYNATPRLSPTSVQPHSRSQRNSPERNPHRLHTKDGLTHLRAHSSPQTGPGTRAHTRPVITPDALSRLSRNLGVSGATTPPRGQTVEVAVAD